MPKGGDTGLLEIKCGVSFGRDGFVIDPSRTEIDVEIWTTVPFGIEQNRGHCVKSTITGNVDTGYETAYRQILGAYEDFWKSEGAIPPPDWKTQLARAIGDAMGKFMQGPGSWPDLVLN